MKCFVRKCDCEASSRVELLSGSDIFLCRKHYLSIIIKTLYEKCSHTSSDGVVFIEHENNYPKFLDYYIFALENDLLSLMRNNMYLPTEKGKLLLMTKIK